MIFETFGVSMQEARTVARVIGQVLEVAHVEGFVIPGICAPDFLPRLGIRRLPAVRAEDGEVLWQGSVPAEDVVKSWIASEPTSILPT